MKVVIKKIDKYLFVKFILGNEFKKFKDILLQIKEQAIKHSCNNILIDCYNLSTSDKNFHRYLAGKDIAEILPRPFKIAILYPEKHITKFGENTAVNRGANLLVHHDKSYAQKWLIDDFS